MTIENAVKSGLLRVRLSTSKRSISASRENDMSFPRYPRTVVVCCPHAPMMMGFVSTAGYIALIILGTSGGQSYNASLMRVMWVDVVGVILVLTRRRIKMEGIVSVNTTKKYGLSVETGQRSKVSNS